MNGNSTKQHWEKIYQAKDTVREVSWYQDNPKTSIDLILSTGVDKSASIIDIGGGDSKLVDKLLELDFKNIFVLDISTKALQKAKSLNLTGWVRNAPDGNLEILAQGTKKDLEKLIVWAKEGPKFANVKDIQIAWRKPQEKYSDFEIR